MGIYYSSHCISAILQKHGKSSPSFQILPFPFIDAPTLHANLALAFGLDHVPSSFVSFRSPPPPPWKLNSFQVRLSTTWSLYGWMDGWMVRSELLIVNPSVSYWSHSNLLLTGLALFPFFFSPSCYIHVILLPRLAAGQILQPFRRLPLDGA